MTSAAVRTVIDQSVRDGVVRSADLRVAGLSGVEITRARKAGDLDRVVMGISLPRGVVLDDRSRTEVALAYAGDGALLTGVWAARLDQLKWVPQTDVRHVIVEAGRRRRGESAAWITVQRCAWHPQMPRRLVGGVPLAPLPKVVVDAGRELETLRDARGVVLGALADRRCTRDQLYEVLGRGGTAGTAHVRRALKDAERGAASPPEAEVADTLVGRGVPFYVNCEIEVNGKTLGVADIWLVGLGVGGEIDSREEHEAPIKLDDTFARDKKFMAAGLWLEHVTPARFRRNPEGWVRELFAVAERRRREGHREPAGLVLRPRGPLLS